MSTFLSLARWQNFSIIWWLFLLITLSSLFFLTSKTLVCDAFWFNRDLFIKLNGLNSVLNISFFLSFWHCCPPAAQISLDKTLIFLAFLLHFWSLVFYFLLICSFSHSLQISIPSSFQLSLLSYSFIFSLAKYINSDFNHHHHVWQKKFLLLTPTSLSVQLLNFQLHAGHFDLFIETWNFQHTNWTNIFS